MEQEASTNGVGLSDAQQQYKGRYADLDSDKLRGGYYTPKPIADWLCSWAIQKQGDFVLEPSCGDGVFLESASETLEQLGATKAGIARTLTGVELVAEEVAKAEGRLFRRLGDHAEQIVRNDDFFEWWSERRGTKFDAIVGNPPFIRYQSFPEPHRSRAMDIMKNAGLSPNRLTNIWVPFVVASAEALRSGGRLALVLPAELLQVSYASQLRSYLTDRFRSINLVACNELFFKNAEQEVILLLADEAISNPSALNNCKVTMTAAETISELLATSPTEIIKNVEAKVIQHDNEKWLKYFLSAKEIELMRELRISENTTNLGTHAEVRVGVVTGKNKFFVMTKSEASERGLVQYNVPLVSRSAHLSGACIGKREWQKLSDADNLVHLLDLNNMTGEKLTKPLKDYIEQGESENVHKGYKCSIRDPWYAVPSIWNPDGFLFRQIYDFPRAVLNTAGATSTDTIHRMRCKSNPRKVIANTYSHLTAASAEIEGRSYGGGVLELEPTEAERLLMPKIIGPAVSLSECDKLIRDGRIGEVLALNDRVLLQEHMGLSKKDCNYLKCIWEKMRDRRLKRRQKVVR